MGVLTIWPTNTTESDEGALESMQVKHYYFGKQVFTQHIHVHLCAGAVLYYSTSLYSEPEIFSLRVFTGEIWRFGQVLNALSIPVFALVRAEWVRSSVLAREKACYLLLDLIHVKLAPAGKFLFASLNSVQSRFS